MRGIRSRCLDISNSNDFLWFFDLLFFVPAKRHPLLQRFQPWKVSIKPRLSRGFKASSCSSVKFPLHPAASFTLLQFQGWHSTLHLNVMLMSHLHLIVSLRPTAAKTNDISSFGQNLHKLDCTRADGAAYRIKFRLSWRGPPFHRFCSKHESLFIFPKTHLFWWIHTWIHRLTQTALKNKNMNWWQLTSWQCFLTCPGKNVLSFFSDSWREAPFFTSFLGLAIFFMCFFLTDFFYDRFPHPQNCGYFLCI